MLRPAPRRVLAVLGAVAAVAVGGLVAPVPPADAHQDLPAQCLRLNPPLSGQHGTWVVLPIGDFPSGPKSITAHAVDPYYPARWFVTNGKVVLRSQNGGCTWQEVFRLPAVADENVRVTAADRITGITITAPSNIPDQEGPSKVFLSVAAADDVPAGLPKLPGAVPPPPSGVVTLTQVVRSTNSGNPGSWESAGPLAQPVGGPGPLKAAPNQPNIVYAVAGGVVNVTTDGGRTWTAGTVPTATTSAGSPLLRELTVDYADAKSVWARTAGRVVHSTDSGRTWSVVDVPVTGAVGPAVSLAAAKPSYIHVPTSAAAGGPVTALHVSRGQGFTKIGVSGPEAPAQSIAGGRAGEAVLVATAGDPAKSGVFRYDPDEKTLVDIDEFGLARKEPFRDVQADPGTDGYSRFYFHTANKVAFWAPLNDKDAPHNTSVVPEAQGFFEPPPPPVGSPARLSPPTAELPVQPGGSADTPYTLDLPKRPTKIDVFFLLDTSKSTDPYLKGMRDGLADLSRRLASASVDAQFGLGEYQDQDEVKYVRYRLRDQIGLPDRDFQVALRKLSPDGGTFEPGYTALHQMATGTGIPSPAKGARVDPGQHARWRPGAYRVAVVVADEPFVADPSGADRNEAVQALTERAIHTIGIHVGPVLPDPAEAATGTCAPINQPPITTDELKDAIENRQLRCQMLDVARATSTVAPAGGVDCDGDGRIDAAPGRPLVCGLESEAGGSVVQMAGPLARILTALTSPAPVDLVASDERVSIQPGGDFDAVDIKADARLGFTATAACAASEAGKVLPVVLTARVATAPVAAAKLNVLCGDPPPVAPAKPAAAPAPQGPAPAPAQAPVAAPGPLPQGAIAISNLPPPPVVLVNAPAVQPGAMPAAQHMPMGQAVQAPGAAAARQRQESPALVRIDNGATKPGQDLAFSAYGGSSPDRTPLVPLVGGLLATAAATVHAVRRRPSAPARARWR